MTTEPNFDDLPFEDMLEVERRREAFRRDLAGDPGTRFDDYLTGLPEPARRVLLQDLVLEEYDHRQERSARAIATEIGTRHPGDRALVDTVLAQRTVVDREPAAEFAAAGWPWIYGYEVSAVLSDRGSSAVVYRALDRRTQREVALEVLRREHWESGDGLNQFRQEARLQVELHGAGVPVVYATGFADGGWPYIAMELVRGEPLQTRLPGAGEPFCFDPAQVQLIRTVADALAAAHRHRPHPICHLDLSPNNVFVTPEGRIVILDWGLGRDPGALADARGGGTPDFLAPEKARGEVARYSPRSDVFSLGCFLVWALTGRRLYPEAPTVEEKLRLVAANDLSEPTTRLKRATAAHGAPPELVRLTLDCLQPDPDRRPEDARVAARIADYFDAAEEERRRQRERATRRRYLRFVVVVLVLVAGVTWGTTRYYARQTAAARFVSLAAEGNTAAEAGRWHQARLAWQAVLADRTLGASEHLELRLRLVRAAQFLNDREYVKRELDALDADPGAEHLRGRLAFERAVYTLTPAMEYAFADPKNVGADHNPHETEALALLRRVSGDETVPEADRLTAQAMLAPTAEKALPLYQQALARQPFHPYAGPYYLVTCLVAGRLEQAQARAAAWAEAAPEDPLPWFYKAFVLTLQRRHTEADAALARLTGAGGGGRVLPLATVRACVGVVKAARVVGDRLPEAAVSDGTEVPAVQFAFLVELGGALPGGADVSKSVVFALPLTPHQRRAAGRLLTVATAPGDARAALSELVGVDDFVAPGLAEFVRGIVLVRSGQPDAAADALRRCVESPYQWWDVRAVCWLCLATHDLARSRRPEHAATATDLRASARDHLRRAAREPGLPPRVRAKVKSLAGELNDPEFRAEIDRVLASSQ